MPVVPSDAVDAHLWARARTLAGDHLEGERLPCRARDGSVVEVRAWTMVMETVADGPPEVVVLLVDVTEEGEAERALRKSEHRWRTLVQNVSDTVTVVDGDGVILSTTGELKPILGYPSETWVGRNLTEIVHPDELDGLQPFIDEVLAHPGTEVSTEVRVRHHDGGWVDLYVNVVNLLHDEAVAGVVLTTRNITGRKQAEHLASSQARILELIARDAPLDEALEAIAEMVEDHDLGSRAAVLMVEGDRLRPRARLDRGPGPDLRAAIGEIELSPETRATLSREHGVPVVVTDVHGDPRARLLRSPLTAEGYSSFWWAPVLSAATAEPVGAVIAFHPEHHQPSEHARRAADVACTLVSIATDRHSTAIELAHRTLHDDLTGLPNRTLLLDRLETGIDRARRGDGEVSVLFVDIDRFTMVNESLGHEAGDAVIVAVAERLRSVTRPGDTVARVGADEFVVLCDRPGTLATVLAVADRLTEAMREPLVLGDNEVFLTVSLGLAQSTPDIDAPNLLRHADSALFRAKQRGRDRLEMYDSAMQASAHDRLSLGSHLRRAIDHDELRVVYQPIVALDTGAVVGAEALLRWRHPVRGDVPPAVFIPIAEETGTIREIGAWVLETALGELADLVAIDRAPFTLSVNLSPRQLDDADLVPRVVAALAAHRCPADRLCLELTETALTDDLETALGVLVRLRATGVRIAVDDFGTGYSSLAHLQRFPVDTIKIDRTFVQGLGESAGTDRSAIASAVLGIAAAMGLDAVAEGVETASELTTLRALGCPLGQGYLFSVPLPAAALAALVAGRS